MNTSNCLALQETAQQIIETLYSRSTQHETDQQQNALRRHAKSRVAHVTVVLTSLFTIEA